MSLTRRLVVTVVALVVVLSLLVALVASLLMRGYFNGRLDEQLGRLITRASDGVQGGRTPQPSGDPTVTPAGPGSLCGELPPIPFGQSARSITAVYSSTCRAGVRISDDAALVPLSSAALDALTDVETDAVPHTVDLPGLGTMRVAATRTDDGDVVVAGLPTDPVDDALARLVWWQIVLTVGGAAAAAAAGSFLVRRNLRPLREVAATAHEVTTLPLASGEVGRTVRVPEPLTDPASEVGQVGEALNRMIGHVEEALDARYESEQRVRQFLADASHELRTPLSTIRGYAELGRRTGTDQLEKVESEAARMSTLVEDMLLLARLDSGRPLERETVDLVLLVAEATTDARVVDPHRTWRLDLPDEPVEVEGDALRLHQAVTNLLRNASRHTPPGTTVTARVRGHARGGALVQVHDDGPGLDPTLVPTVFGRFIRGDSSRTRESGGAGLGTALVRAIAQAHGGTASVRSEPGDTTFTIDLPRP